MLKVLTIVLMVLTASPAVWAGPTGHVIVITIDGMFPDFYLPGSWVTGCENVRWLRDNGSYAKKMLPVYPSVTYVSHTSIITGDYPNRHGVTANNVFKASVYDGRGYWYASDIKTPALWDVAHKQGRSVAVFSWPVSAGSASIDWNIPEFWSSFYGDEITLMKKHTTPEALTLYERKHGAFSHSKLHPLDNRDRLYTDAAIEVLINKKPDLLLLHLVELDHEEHFVGRRKELLLTVARRLDDLVGRVVQATRTAGIFDQTTFVIMGDHGFDDVKTSLAVNALLAQNGWIELGPKGVEKWKAMIQNTGGSAGVYMSDPEDRAGAEKLKSFLKEHSVDASGKKLFSIIDKRTLESLRGPVQPVMYLEAEHGYMFVKTVSGKEWIRNASLAGNHGYLPTKDAMATGFIACGRGIRKGVVIEQASVVDVAPTVAKLLGFEMPDPDGKVLNSILTGR